MDKSWIGERNRLCKEYQEGIKSFIDVARNHLVDGRSRCPCQKCRNAYIHHLTTIENHLLINGMSRSYTVWVYHGENFPLRSHSSDGPFENVENEEDDEDNDELLLQMLNEGLRRWEGNDNIREAERTENTLGGNADKFEGLFGELEEELYPGCKKFSSFHFIVKLIHLKVLNRWSNASFNMLLQLLKDALPRGANIPDSHYNAKRKLRDLGLGYESIHACKYDCALFWKEHEKADKCPVCDEPRYKQVNVKGKNIPHKTLRYFPLKPRLQRLFMSSYTAADMRWHMDKRADIDGELRHPADAMAWKDLDQRYPRFGQDPRNVRLGLATDGFNPYGNMSLSYSLWPVVLVPYNLPLWKCMKESSFMMALLIPGKNSPGKDMDVYLRPLVDELKELWDVGVETYDVYGKEYFRMYAAVLWTLNDFPAYGNLSGWSTKGYKACPICNNDTSSRGLTSKICYMGHRRWLNQDHSWRRSKKHDGERELRSAPRELTGDDILKQLDQVKTLQPGKHPNNKDRKRKRTKEELNWTTRSIFFELEYWSNLKLRHNLDVMHIEKNICDSVLGTLMSIEGKSKDTDKARLEYFAQMTG